MTWRVLVLLSLMAVCGCTSSATHTRPEPSNSFRIEVRQTGSETAEPPLVMSCVEATLCRGQTKLLFDQTLQTVTVVALITRGAAYLKFSIGEVPLFIGSQPYVYVATGRSKISLHDKLPQGYFEDQQGLYQRPVLRSQPVLATIAIGIDPSPTE